jgi:hypothetical protein
MDSIKDFGKRVLSRKFVFAILTSFVAYQIAIADGIITNEELGFIVSGPLSFIGFEGVRDIVAAGNINALGSINAIGTKPKKK